MSKTRSKEEIAHELVIEYNYRYEDDSRYGVYRFTDHDDELIITIDDCDYEITITHDRYGSIFGDSIGVCVIFEYDELKLFVEFIEALKNEENGGLNNE